MRNRIWSPALLGGTPAALVLATTLMSYDDGVQSGRSGVAANVARVQPSCGQCHSGSFGNGPNVSLTVTKHALQPGEAISATTNVSGGVSGTEGGFVTEATRGTFTAGGTTLIFSNPASITHSNEDHRNWTYGFTAPATAGLVELFSVGMSANGSGTRGDKYAFAGFDPDDPSATAVRLFVLPQGVIDIGPGCPDGFGNQSVMGANGVPTVGNAGFALELHGITPTSLGFVLVGFNPPTFTSLPLGALFGLTGCDGYVANPIATLSGFTTAGIAERAEGTATIGLAIPPSAQLQGTRVAFQGAYIDPTAQATLGRSFPVSFTNGLKATIQ